MKYKAVQKKKASRPAPDLLPWAAGIFLGLLPFVVSPSGLDRFRIPKEAVLYLAVTALVVIWLGWRNREIQRGQGGWFWFVLAGLGYLTGHAFLVGRISQSLPGLFAILFVGALYLVLSQIVQSGHARSLWLVSAIAISLNAWLAVLQYYGAFPIMMASTGDPLSGRATPAGLIGNVNTGGILFALFSLLALHGVFVGDSKRLRLVWGGILLSCLTGLLFTQTLTAMLGLIVCLAFWLVFHHWWSIRFFDRPWRRLATLWLVLVLVLSAGFVVASRSGTLDRVTRVVDRVSEGRWNAATSGRVPVYQLTWQMIQRHPVLGTGLNSFGRLFFEEKTDTEAGRELRLPAEAGSFRQTHNEYLQVWQELGIIGLTFFLGFLLIPLGSGVRRLFQLTEPDEAYWMAVLCLGWLLILISCLAFFPFHLAITGAYVILLLSCLRSHEEGQNSHSLTRALSSLGRLKIPILVAVALALAYVPVGLWIANREMGVAAFILEQAQATQLSGRQSRVFADEALVRLDRAQSWSGNLAEADQLRGSALVFLGRYDQAEEAYRMALQRIPSPELCTNLAVVLMQQGKLDAARGELERALRYNPESPPALRVLESLNSQRR